MMSSDIQCQKIAYKKYHVRSQYTTTMQMDMCCYYGYCILEVCGMQC